MTNEFQMTEEDFRLLASKCSIEAHPKLTKEDEILASKLRAAMHLIGNKNEPEADLIKIANTVLPAEFSKILIHNYLAYVSLDSASIDILTYRILFAMKDPGKAIALYQKNLSRLEEIRKRPI